MKTTSIAVILLLAAHVVASAQAARLPLPQYVTAMRAIASTPECAVFVTPRNVFAAASLSSEWRHCSIAPYQRDIELVGVGSDTIVVMLTFGTMAAPQRAVFTSVDAGISWMLLHRLDATVGEVVGLLPGVAVCTDYSESLERRVVIVNLVTGGVQSFATPFPSSAVLKGAAKNGEIVVGVTAWPTPLGVLRVNDVLSQEQWLRTYDEATARRPYQAVLAQPQVVAQLTPDGVLIPGMFGDSLVPLPKEIDATMCIEPAQVLVAANELLMTYRDRLYRWNERLRQWETRGAQGGSLALAMVADTIVMAVEGRYPTIGVESAYGNSRASIGMGLSDAAVVPLWQAGGSVWVGAHCFLEEHLQRHGLVRWQPSRENSYATYSFQPENAPRVVGYGGIASPSKTWLAGTRLMSIADGDSTFVDEGGITGAGGEVALAAGAGTTADVAVSTMRVMRRLQGEQDWQTVGTMRQMPFADAVLVGDTVWAFSIDPGLTSDDNVLLVTVFVANHESLSLQEVHRGRDRAVYRWASSTPIGMLVHVGNALRASNDGGKTWIPVPLAVQEMVRPVLVDNVLWSAGLLNGQPVLLWSRDGLVWNVVATVLPVDAVPTSIAVKGEHVVIATTTGLYQLNGIQVSVHSNESNQAEQSCGRLRWISDLMGRVVFVAGSSERVPERLLPGVYVLVYNDCSKKVMVGHDGWYTR
jgi:hypothetical protein